MGQSYRLSTETPRASELEEHGAGRTILADPWVRLGREICGNLEAARRREWLVTNGLGGYASGTVSGINTRRYHGLLVAALAPPVDRTVLVAGTVEWISYAGRRYPLSTHEYGDGTVAPDGYRHIESFRLEGTIPVWTFALADVLLERRVWMQHGANTTFVEYRLVRGTVPVELVVTPLVTYRGFHALTSGDGWRPVIEVDGRTLTVRAFPDATPYYIGANTGDLREDGNWYWNFLHRQELARGLEDRSDLYAAGEFRAVIEPGQHYSLTLTTEPQSAGDSAAAYDRERARQTDILRTAGVEQAEPTVQQLTLAADQFVVRRDAGSGGTGKTIIAGYHWFNDWGRDTMIALPGLTLTTGRPADAADILRTFAGYVADGLLPNNFPDQSGTVPGYNTADATLWYVLAIHAYHQETGDDALVNDLLPVLRRIVEAHVDGTRYGIGVDPADGLLRAGEPGYQLTWMDARIGDWVVTPRIGKPVEINALWYNVLNVVAELLIKSEPSAAADFKARAEQVKASFRQRFIASQHEHLADVVDGPDGDDWTFRPNQIFAISLPFPVLDGEDARRVVDAVGRELLTSFGLRSLAQDDPAYRGDYGGDPYRRDSGYHQGPVWAWLSGAYAEAHFRVYRDREAALSILSPYGNHLRDAGLGSIAEIFEGDPPHQPRGCIAQAWSVAETLRVWRMLTE